MPTYTEVTENLGNKIVEVVTNAEDNAIAAVGKANKLAATMKARVARTLPATLTAKLPTARRFENLPTAKDIVAANTTFLKRLVDAQNAFALKVIDAVRPDAPAEAGSAPMVATTSAAAPAPVAENAAPTVKAPKAVKETVVATVAAVTAAKPVAKKATAARKPKV